MAQQTVDVGSFAGDGTGDPLREAFTKINENFAELYQGSAFPGALTYANVSSNVAGVTFAVTRFVDSYSAIPVLNGTNQSVGDVYLILGNVLGGTTPLNDLRLTVTSLANVTVGNIATVDTFGVPVAPVLKVNNQTGNVVLTVNNIENAASKGYVNTAIASNVANFNTSLVSLQANVVAANLVIAGHTSQLDTLESNSSAQAVQINSLVAVKANVTYVDNAIDLALSSNAILANVASVNANVAAANAAILTKASLSGAVFTGNITAGNITSVTHTYTKFLDVGDSPVPDFFTNRGATFIDNVASFYGLYLQNKNNNATADLIVWSDDESTENYVAVGVAGTNYSDPRYPKQLPRDTYVYAVGGNLYLESETHAVQMITANVVRMEVQQSGTVRILSNLTFADGTVQNTAFGGNTDTAAINANVTAANVEIANLKSNAAVQSLDIVNLYSNDAVQAASINSLTANAATQAGLINNLAGDVNLLTSNAATQTNLINSLIANAAVQSVDITSLTANSVSQQLDINNLYGNAGAQAAAIGSLIANSATQAVQINNINSNVAAANISIDFLSSNSATQAIQINSINSNVTAVNLAVTNLQSNATSQALDIANLYSNINVYLANVALANANLLAANAQISAIESGLLSTNANVSAANARISAIESSVSATDANISAANAQISAIESSVSSTNANVQAANAAIDTKAAISGQIFTGNIVAPYVLANANVKVAGAVEVGDSSPIDYPGLAGVFTGNVDSYYQVVIQNTNSGPNASGDLVLTADDGTDTTNYLNIGINSSGWSGNFTVPAGDTGYPEFPHDSYVTAIGGNLALRSDQDVYLAANLALVALFKDGDLTLFGTNLKFADGTIQSTAVEDVPGLLANVAELSNSITATNLAVITANIGMKDYVDSQVFAATNLGNVVFSDTTISTSNDATQGIVLNSAGNGEIAMLDYVGINNTNPGYWLHIGDGTLSANTNTGNISVDYSNGLGTSRASTIIGYAWWDTGGNGNDNRGTGAHSHFGIYKNDDTFDTKFIEFETATGNVTVGNLTIEGNVDFTMANYQNWTSNVSTLSEALNQLAERLKALGG